MSGSPKPDPDSKKVGLPPGEDPNHVSASPPTFFASIEDLTQSLMATEDSTSDARSTDHDIHDRDDRVNPAKFNATLEVPSDSDFSGSGSGKRPIQVPSSVRAGSSGRGSSGRGSSGQSSSGQDSSGQDSGANAGEQDEGPKLPKRVGKFLIKSELGRGAFGVVYLGYDEELQRNVAIKVSLVSDPHLQERLRVEASKVAQIESHGIVPVYHIGTTESGAFFIVQKYINGTSLGDVLKNGPLSPARAARLIRDIALGLEPAHLQDILHRDLKPDNILVESNGRAWIADFGLAISEEEQVAGRRELAGTLPYMSPEQISGRIDFLDPRSDIWALGVMYYQLLTGKLPFTGTTRQALTEQICQRDPRPLQQRAPGHLTEAMNHVFLRCCAKQPSDRYASVRELAIELDEMLLLGLSDQNIHGESMESRLGESFADNTTVKSTRSATIANSQFVSSSVGGTVAPWWVSLSKGLIAVVAIVGLSILGNVGYQQYTASHLDSDDTDATATVGMATVGSTDPSVGDSEIAGNSTAADASVIPPFESGDEFGEMDVEDLEVEDFDTDTPKTAAMKPTAAAGAVGPVPVEPEPPATPKFDADGSAEKPWYVAADGSGSHKTISEAVAAGPVGAFIRLAPGLYPETIRITTPCSIVGVPRDSMKEKLQCEIENGDASPLTIDCPNGLVSIENIYVDGKGRNYDAKFNAVDVLGGTLHLAGCDLETSSQNCVKVHRGASLDVKACHFVDSNEFSISTNDHKDVQVSGCLFDASGVQLVGGAGTITDCKFYGKSGVHLSLSPRPVQISACTFSGNRKFSIAATTGAKLIASECDIDECEVGVLTSVSAAQNDAQGLANGARVQLIAMTMEDCQSGVVVEGGSVVQLSGNCNIRGGTVGIGIGIGSVSVADSTITGSDEKAVWGTSAQSKLTMTSATISRSKNTAIEMMAGETKLSDVKIEGCLYGFTLGDEAYSDQLKTSADLKTVKISECTGVGVVVYQGRVAIEDMSVAFGSYGLLCKGPDNSKTPLPNPAPVEVSLKRSTFTSSKGTSVQALGGARVTIDDETWKTIETAGGAKALAPAEVNVGEKNPGGTGK